LTPDQVRGVSAQVGFCFDRAWYLLSQACVRLGKLKQGEEA